MPTLPGAQAAPQEMLTVQIKPVTTSQYAGDFPSTRGKTDCSFSQYFNSLFSVPRERNLTEKPTQTQNPQCKQIKPLQFPQEKAGY